MTIAEVHDLIDPSNVGFAPRTMDTWEPFSTAGTMRGLPDRVVEALDETASSNKNLLIIGANAWAAAKLFHELLPRLSASEARQVACVHSIAGLLTDGQIPTVRPFRAPHHTVAEFGLAGRFDRPGEISLAHYGTLVLDHALDFKRTGLSWLTDIVRTNRVTCKRGDVTIEWPAKCRVVATVYPDELRFLSPERVAFLGEYVRVDV
jgi:magnesium chelatase family protein